MSLEVEAMLLKQLGKLDTPVVCDAIEKLGLQGRLKGFTGPAIRCLINREAAMVGYATTVELDYTTLDKPPAPRNWLSWVKAMEACPKPGVLVIKDGSPLPLRVALWGDVMGWAAKQLGLVGVVTDGLVRDSRQLEGIGMHVFAAGTVASHGNPRVIRVNAPVEIEGVRIQPGDLLHGDADGLVNVPLEHVEAIAAVAKEIAAHEAAVIGYTQSPSFTVEELFRMRFG